MNVKFINEIEQLFWTMFNLEYKGKRFEFYCVGSKEDINDLKQFLNIHHTTADYESFISRCINKDINVFIEEKEKSRIVKRHFVSKFAGKLMTENDLEVLMFCTNPDHVAALLGISLSEKESMINRLEKTEIWKKTMEIRNENMGDNIL